MKSELIRKTSVSKFYRAWVNMKTRCYNERSPDFLRYGGRGIKTDEKWLSFDGFVADMLDSYEEHLTLDRIDNNGDYNKENCRWVDRTAQARNRRTSKLITIGDNTKTMAEWIEHSGVNASTVRQRYYVYRWSIEKSLGLVQFG